MKQNIILEENWINSKKLIHVVGQEDKTEYLKLNPEANVFYTPHPHYAYRTIKKSIVEKKGKLTILISGQNNGIYIGTYWDEITDELIENKILAKNYNFTIIGKNFENSALKLREAGFEVELNEWVESYENKIRHAQIQIFPIVVGTGTKGKVLCAFASGLFCIGTSFAFENIETTLDKKFNEIGIHNSKNLIFILNQILINKSLFESLAFVQSEEVLKNHSPDYTGQLFWEKILNYVDK